MIFVFDAYGTLFDVNGAARRAANEPEMIAIYGCWQSIASGWRERQLRYSWLYSMMDRYEDFWVLTERALDDTLRDHNLSENQSVRARLLELYGELPPYDEVRKVLKRLREFDHPTAVFSNASPNMLEKALMASDLNQWLDEIISVDSQKNISPVLRCMRLWSGNLNVPLPTSLSFLRTIGISLAQIVLVSKLFGLIGKASPGMHSRVLQI